MSNKQKWIEMCKALPVGAKKRVQCCGGDRSRIIEHAPDRYISNCFRPGCDNYVEKKTGVARLTAERCKEATQEILQYKEPRDTTRDPHEFPADAVLWLTKSGLHSSMWEKYGFGYTAKYHRVVVPIWMNGKHVGATMRALDEGDIKYLMKTTVKGAVYTCQASPNNKTVIVTEDILSAIRIKEAVLNKLKADVICILGTGVNMDRALHIASSYERAIFWLDGDEAGVVATRKWKTKLQPYMDVREINYWDHDPKDFTDLEIINLLKGDV